MGTVIPALFMSPLSFNKHVSVHMPQPGGIAAAAIVGNLFRLTAGSSAGACPHYFREYGAFSLISCWLHDFTNSCVFSFLCSNWTPSMNDSSMLYFLIFNVILVW